MACDEDIDDMLPPVIVILAIVAVVALLAPSQCVFSCESHPTQDANCAR